jgi:hypothetical protein
MKETDPFIMNETEWFYVYTIDFDQDNFGIFSTREEAEKSLEEQITGHGPAWEDCHITRRMIHGKPEIDGR